MHDNFDDLFSGQKRHKLTDGDILETKEVALDRIHECESIFLVTKKAGNVKMDIVFLAPVSMREAFGMLEGVDALRAAIWQQYVDILDREDQL